MKVEVAIINAFVDQDRGGNPAGVVLDADHLTHQQKLAIAREVGLSETAFVSASDMADFKLDFYTPQKQIAHCGHATIGTFSYLSSLGRVPGQHSSKETIDGKRNVEVQGQLAYMEQLAPSYTSVEESPAFIAKTLGIQQQQLIHAPMIANTGNGFMIIAVDSEETLKQLVADLPEIEALSDKYDLIGFYVFTRETHVPGRDASTRMFAPRYGITEESATGMAAGPLACFLYDVLKVKKADFEIEQGYAMAQPSPSVIKVNLNLSDGDISSLMAGGIGIASRFETISF